MKPVSPGFMGLLLGSSVHTFALDAHGHTATHGPAPWLRTAQFMLPQPYYVHSHLTLVPPLTVEVRPLMDPAVPPSPCATPWSLTPHPPECFDPHGLTQAARQAVFGQARHGKAVCGDHGQQGTPMDVRGHFGGLHQPGETLTYYSGLTPREVVGPSGPPASGPRHR